MLFNRRKHAYKTSIYYLYVYIKSGGMGGDDRIGKPLLMWGEAKRML